MQWWAWRVWLVLPGKCTIGNYTYLDGELHVKLSLCADSLIDGQSTLRRTFDLDMCDPTHRFMGQTYTASAPSTHGVWLYE